MDPDPELDPYPDPDLLVRIRTKCHGYPTLQCVPLSKIKYCRGRNMMFIVVRKIMLLREFINAEICENIMKNP